MSQNGLNNLFFHAFPKIFAKSRRFLTKNGLYDKSVLKILVTR